jgi:hypothetical protein
VLDPRVTRVWILVIDVDVAGAALVRTARDRTDERRVLGRSAQPEHLALTDIRTDLHRKTCVALEPLFGRHRGKPTRLVATVWIR